MFEIVQCYYPHDFFCMYTESLIMDQIYLCRKVLKELLKKFSKTYTTEYILRRDNNVSFQLVTGFFNVVGMEKGDYKSV